MYESKTTAQWFTLALSILLLTVGVVGLIVEAIAGSGHSDLYKSLFQLWYSILYSLTGLLGFASWRRADSARIYAMGVGIVYLAFAIWGFAASPPGYPSLAWFVGATPFDYHPVFWVFGDVLTSNICHAVLGIAGLAIGYFSPGHGRYPVPAEAT